MLLLRLNSEGNEVKRRVFEQKSTNSAYVLTHRTSDDITFLAGMSANKKGVKNDLAVVATDAEGNSLTIGVPDDRKSLVVETTFGSRF